jgi:hypothetical protein
VRRWLDGMGDRTRPKIECAHGRIRAKASRDTAQKAAGPTRVEHVYASRVAVGAILRGADSTEACKRRGQDTGATVGYIDPVRELYPRRTTTSAPSTLGKAPTSRRIGRKRAVDHSAKVLRRQGLVLAFARNRLIEHRQGNNGLSIHICNDVFDIKAF